MGVIGTGHIGLIFADIMHGFGCRVVASDPFPSPDAKPFVEYVPLATLFASADIISLHCPLTPETHHLIDADAIAQIVITGHQTFFTAEALTNIAETTLANIDAFESGSGTMHRVVDAKLD